MNGMSRPSPNSELRKSEEFLRGIIESSDDCLKVLTLEGAFLFVSKNSVEKLELAHAEEMVGKSWLDVWELPGDREAAGRAIRDAAAGGVGRFTGYYRTGSGQREWWDVVVTKISRAAEEEQTLLAVSRDVTQLQKNTRRIQNLQTITSALSEGATLHDVTKILLDQGLRIFGASSGLVIRYEVNAKYLTVLDSRNYPEELVAAWQACPIDRELPVPTALRSGKPIYLESPNEILARFPQMTPIVASTGLASFIAVPLIAKGKTVCALGLAFSEPKHFVADDREYLELVASQCALGFDRALLTAELIKERDSFERAVVAREEFLSIASHELKTPLTALKMQAQLQTKLLAKNDPGEFDRSRYEKFSGLVVREVNRLDKLVDDMLDFARMKTGRIQLRKQAVDLVALLTEIEKKFEPQFFAAGFPPPVLVTPTALTIDCDRDRIEQVIINLLTNALRYGKNGEVQISLVTSGDEIKLTVADHGIGIKPETIGRIFDKFERDVSASEVSGLGLGLFICRQIVEAHGGTISVESTLGVGSRFCVTLPVHSSR